MFNFLNFEVSHLGRLEIVDLAVTIYTQATLNFIYTELNYLTQI